MPQSETHKGYKDSHSQHMRSPAAITEFPAGRTSILKRQKIGKCFENNHEYGYLKKTHVYLSFLSEPESNGQEVSLKPRKFVGPVELPDDFDEERELREYLQALTMLKWAAW